MLREHLVEGDPQCSRFCIDVQFRPVVALDFREVYPEGTERKPPLSPSGDRTQLDRITVDYRRYCPSTF